MKHWLTAVITVLCLVLALSACGRQPSAASDAENIARFDPETVKSTTTSDTAETTSTTVKQNGQKSADGKPAPTSTLPSRSTVESASTTMAEKTTATTTTTTTATGTTTQPEWGVIVRP